MTSTCFRLLCTGTLFVVSFSLANAQELTGDQFKKELPSTSVLSAVAPNGSKFKLFLRPDGTAERQTAANKMVKGKWEISGNQVCLAWEDQGAPGCNTVIKVGTRYDFKRDGKLTASVTK
jgi:hypothetical protein